MVTSLVSIAVMLYTLFIKYLQICRNYLMLILYQLSWLLLDDIIVGGEDYKIYYAACSGNLHTIQQLASSGVDVTGIVDPYEHEVSMCVAIY